MVIEGNFIICSRVCFLESCMFFLVYIQWFSRYPVYRLIDHNCTDFIVEAVPEKAHRTKWTRLSQAIRRHGEQKIAQVFFLILMDFVLGVASDIQHMRFDLFFLMKNIMFLSKPSVGKYYMHIPTALIHVLVSISIL